MRLILVAIYLAILIPSPALSHPLDHPAEMAYKGVAKFNGEKIDRIHVNGSAILDGTKVEKVIKVHGTLEAYEADINNLKLEGTAELKKCIVHVRARIRGDLKAEDTTFKDGIAAAAGHLILSHVTSGPIDFQQLSDAPSIQKLTITNGTVINGPVIFEKGRGEIIKDKSSKINGQIVGEYTLKEMD